MIAGASLLLWPVISAVFYSRLSLPTALCATLIGGYLLLPTQTELDLPLLPALDKNSIPALSALVLTAITLKNRPQLLGAVLPGWVPRSPVVIVLLTTLFLSAIMMTITNPDPIVYIYRSTPGMRPYDAFSSILSLFIMFLPYFLARKFLSGSEGTRVLLVAMVMAGLAYSLLALFEMRMSPKLNMMVYDFFPHYWLQHKKNGHWRPIIFLEHGLWVAIFFSCTLLAAFGLWRSKAVKKPKFFLWAGIWLLVVLTLSQNLGALVISLALLPVLLFNSTRFLIVVAGALAVIVLAYPVLRLFDYVPVDLLLEYANLANPKRAASLAFRFENEDLLLEKARERALFGWGGWGRSLVYDERGSQISVPDGRWVILFGVGGWLRYLSEFGLLVYAIFPIAFGGGRHTLNPITGTLVLALIANMIDLIPNAGISPLTFMMAGALAGTLETRTASREIKSVPSIQSDARIDRPASVYARTFNSDGTPTSLSGGGGSQEPPLAEVFVTTVSLNVEINGHDFRQTYVQISNRWLVRL